MHKFILVSIRYKIFRIVFRVHFEDQFIYYYLLYYNLFIIFLTIWKIQIEKNSKFNSNLYFIKKKELQIPIVMFLKRKQIEIRWIPKFHRFKHSRKVAWTSEYINAILTNLVYSIQSVIACRSRAVGTHFA